MSHLGRAFGVAVMALVAVGCWPVPGGGPSRQAHNPFERGIDVGNVAGFTEQWGVVVGPDVGPARQPLPAGHPIVSEERLVHVATEQSHHGIDPVTGAER